MPSENPPFSRLDRWLSEGTRDRKLIVVYGPTSSGKTDASLDIAEYVGGVIIGADSRQLYRDLVIGTGVIRPEEMRGVPHLLISFLSMSERYSAGRYRDDALYEIRHARQYEKIPILCGGTGLYIDSVVYDSSLPATPPNPEYRNTLETMRITEGNLALWYRLHALDPETARTIDPGSYPYVIRALELLEVYGISRRSLTRSQTPVYDTFFYTPYDGDREALYARIDRRVEAMMEEWLVDEIRTLLSVGHAPDAPGFDTIGYREILDALQGKCSLDNAKTLIQKKTRHYAKRQLTWFRRYPGVED